MIEIKNITSDIVKDNKKKHYIQKSNHLMVGFISWDEFFSKILSFKQCVFNFLISVVTIITSFINNYIWDDAKAIYFMLFLISVDASTGIAKSIKQGTFSSSRLPRIFVIMITYTTLLAISWNVSKFSSLYYWLPGALYGGFIATLIVSIFENLHELKLIPEKVYALVKSKLDALQYLLFGDKNKKRKK